MDLRVAVATIDTILALLYLHVILSFEVNYEDEMTIAQSDHRLLRLEVVIVVETTMGLHAVENTLMEGIVVEVALGHPIADGTTADIERGARVPEFVRQMRMLNFKCHAENLEMFPTCRSS